MAGMKIKICVVVAIIILALLINMLDLVNVRPQLNNFSTILV